MNKLIWKMQLQLLPIFLVLNIFASQAWANENILVQGKGHSITAKDLQIDALLRIPPEHREALLSQPMSANRIAMNLYVRRVMADQAKAAKLDADPTVATAIQLALEKVLSDAWLDRLDAQNSMPADVLERLARAAYTAKLDKYKIEEQVRVRHILIADPTEVGRAEAVKILADLKSGADFEKLAKERSADPGSAAKGGDLGYFGTGVMAKPFQDAAFALQKPGQLSDVVATKYGFHVLKFEGRKAPSVRPYDEVKETIVNEIRSNALQRARADAAQRIEAEATSSKQAIEEFAAAQKSKP